MMNVLRGLLVAACFALGASQAWGQSPNLGCDHIPSNPTQGEITANEATDCLDEAGNETRAWTITGNTTVTQAQLAEGVLHVLGGTPSAFNFDLPSGVDRLFAVSNGTGVTATVQVTGGGGDSVAVPNGDTMVLHSDGTDVVALAAAADVVSPPWTAGIFKGGTMSNSELLAEYIFVEAVTCPDDFSGAQLHARTAANAETVIDIEKNGTAIGDVTVAAAGTSGTFTTDAGTVSFTSGDRIAWIGPATADTTLADTKITISCTRD